jgi:hypothetical protein
LIARSETLLTPYFWVALSARSETKRYWSFSLRSSISKLAELGGPLHDEALAALRTTRR